MNTQTSATSPSITSRFHSGRAQFSPLIRRTAQTTLTRNRLRIERNGKATEVVPIPETLTLETPTPSERWWDPHLVDRLQSPLTRIHE